jgi:hypothetical protein
MRNHQLECDLLVAGGGMAGVCCALAAARNGVSVILVQDRPVPGGNASSEIRMHICGADANGFRGMPLAVEAREGGIIEELRLECCVRNPQRSPSVFDLILYDRLVSQPGLTLMLDTALTGAEMEKGRIRRVFADRQSTEDSFSIEAALYADCTGDGRLGFEAGAPFREGRESRERHGESMAPEKADRLRLGSSIIFQARRHDRPMPFTPPAWARRFTEADLQLRPHAGPGAEEGLEYGYWWIEWGGHLDTIRDNETIRHELLAIVLGIWDHIKNCGDHGAENHALEWFGFVPGKRESRRFTGQHILTGNDLIASTPFPDAIACGGWYIDFHPAAGIDAVEEPPCTQHEVPHLYDIPLRACLSAGVPNLVFAGRNFSATHTAFASTRVMATCAVTGQGLGTAAAFAIRNGKDIADLPEDAAAMNAVQQQLLRDDACLIAVANTDPRDRARDAVITASSETAGGEARLVADGFSRALHGPHGAPPDRAPAGTHRWISDPADGMPQSIELRWPEPLSIAEVQLVFDTGMHRLLTLSQAGGVTARMHWGAPQPETLRDYTITGQTRVRWKVLERVRGNYQRCRVHRLENALRTHALRITAEAANGLDHARIVEIRVYEKNAAPFLSA